MPSAYIYDETNVLNVTQEWQRIVRQLYNHPSIMAWVPINESWGVEQLRNPEGLEKRPRFLLDALYNTTKALDRTRLVVGNDGWEAATTDIIAIHEYSQDANDVIARYKKFQADRHGNPFSHGRPIILPEYQYEGQPIMMTEYGGVKVEEQQAEGWGYGQAAKSYDEMLARMKELTDAILNEPELWGYCYTQLTDVQQEVNGLFTFDRKPKVDVKRYAEVFGRNPEKLK